MQNVFRSIEYSTEMFKLKAQYQESQETIEAINRENKNLADEIRDLMDQLGNGGKSVHEMHKALKRIELEKQELQKALEDAEGMLEQREAKALKAELELAGIRTEIEKRLHEKEEEFENTRFIILFVLVRGSSKIKILTPGRGWMAIFGPKNLKKRPYNFS